MKKYICDWVFIIMFSLPIGCGVRGRPQPPLTPPELGRGQPTFTHGSEEFAVPYVPPVSEASPTPTPIPIDGSAKEKK